VELAKPWLSKLSAGVLKHMMMIKLAELSQLNIDVVTRTLGMPSPHFDQKRGTRMQARPSHPQQPALLPARKGIGLLLHDPGLAKLANDPARWKKLENPKEIRLFIDLLELLRTQPHLHTGALLEHWRGTPEEEHLAELAKWDPLLAADGLEAEFRGIVQRLDTQLVEQRWQELHTKLQQIGLTPAEKAEYSELAAPH
jgi:DNA primase